MAAMLRPFLAICLLSVAARAHARPPKVAPTLAPPSAIQSGTAASGYDKPPKSILDVLHAPSPPRPYVNPTHDTILLVSWQDYPPMSRVAEPFLRLAGVRVEPKNHSRHDTPSGYGITPCARSYVLARIADGAQIRVALPADSCPGSPVWSADGKHFVFQNIKPDAVELWIGDGASGAAHHVPGVRLNPMLGSTVQWMADQKTLLVKLVPDGLEAPPPVPVVPSGPSIQETHAEKGQSSTYETRNACSLDTEQCREASCCITSIGSKTEPCTRDQECCQGPVAMSCTTRTCCNTLNGPCRTNDDCCVSNICNALPGGTGVCKINSGTTICSTPSDCISNSCDLATGTCN
jgi:hypothetical protein